MEIPPGWEPKELFDVEGRCLRLEESLTLFDDESIVERTASFAATRSFDEVAASFDRELGSPGERGFTDEAKVRSLEWSFPGGVVVTLDEEADGSLSVSVSSHDGGTAQDILVAVSRSPLAALDAGLTSSGVLSGVGSVRSEDGTARWHLHAPIDDDERDRLVELLVELGYDDRGLENHFVKGDHTVVVGDYHWTAVISRS
jgi:hypothetical protein